MLPSTSLPVMFGVARSGRDRAGRIRPCRSRSKVVVANASTSSDQPFALAGCRRCYEVWLPGSIPPPPCAGRRQLPSGTRAVVGGYVGGVASGVERSFVERAL